MKESRRDFLKKSGGCALGMVSLATQMHHLGTMSAMAQRAIDANDAVTNYKALVLLYWSGGNDGNNLIVPMHNDSAVSNYANYVAARGTQGLALPDTGAGALLPINVPRMGNLQYGLHPGLGTVAGGINNGIHELWGLGKLAAVVNVGNLARPMLKSQYLNGSVMKPYQLFSHSDQVNQSQTSISGTQAFTGWGGRVADRMTAAGPLIPMITSISGAQLFTAGQTTLPLAIGDSNTPLNLVLHPAGFGSNPPTGSNLARFNAFNQLRSLDLLSSNHLREASEVTDQAIAADNAFQVSQDTVVAFPNTSIGRQLRQVARLIRKRTDLSVTRQIFYVQVGGFDTHTNELNGHANLFSQISQALRSFWDELAAMTVAGGDNMQEAVTTFTLSDFGRTFNPAGSGATVGSDHAWGNHMLVMGGSVNGGNFYGSKRPDGTGDYFPTCTFAGPDDVDTGINNPARGRWLPTTSVDQYAAVLAKWFGLPQDAATLNAVFPNLQFFSGANSALDFMQLP